MGDILKVDGTENSECQNGCSDRVSLPSKGSHSFKQDWTPYTQLGVKVVRA